MRNQAVQVGKETFPWQVAKSTGNHFFRMSGRRVLTVFKKFGKWNYAVQLMDGENRYKNDFATEAEAMSHAEENFGEQAVRPEVSTPRATPRATPELRVVPPQLVQPEREVEVKPEPQVEVEDRQAEEDTQMLSATRSPEDYVNALCAKDQTPWGKVLQHSVGGKQSLKVVALRAGLSVEETLKFLESYDRDFVEVEIKGDDVTVTFLEKVYEMSA